MRFFYQTLCCLSLIVAMAGSARADLKVVASIKPVHSLVAAVMDGVGQPALIIEGTGTPHHYALKPSKARELEEADVIFWIGHDLEIFLEKPVETIGTSALSISLGAASGVTRRNLREGGNFEHQEEDGHVHESETDPHVWLDPRNAAAMVSAIAKTLSEVDPANANYYNANAQTARRRLEALEMELESDIAPVRKTRFIVFHDAYQYFERRFGLQAAGSIAIDPEIGVGARRIAEIRQTIDSLGVDCVFSEPQFDQGLVAVVAEETGAQKAVIDPLGSALQEGPNLYFGLLRGIGQAFRACLGGGNSNGN